MVEIIETTVFAGKYGPINYFLKITPLCIIQKQALYRVKTNFDKDSIEKKTEIIYQKPKTKKGERCIPLFPEIVESLKVHKVTETAKFKTLEWDDLKIKQHFKDGLVFTNELGGHIEPRNLSRKFYSLVKAANIDKANFHSLRHTFCTRGVESGINLVILQDLMGHSSISTTNLYTHSLMEAKKTEIHKLNDVYGKMLEPQKSDSAT